MSIKKTFTITDLSDLELVIQLMEKYDLSIIAIGEIKLQRTPQPIKSYLKEINNPTPKQILDKHEAEKIPVPLKTIIDNDPNYKLWAHGGALPSPNED